MTKTEADAIFARLAALGVKYVSAEYSGSGDSGQFDGFTVYGPNNEYLNSIILDKPVGESDALIVDKVTKRLNNEKFQTFSKELEQMAWDAVDNAGHNGFWNNDGGYGKLVFDVAERTIVLEHSNYTGATEDITHELFSENADVMDEEVTP